MDGTQFKVTQTVFQPGWNICLSSSFFDPAKITARLLKPAPKDARGTMFVYLWRRFGYPADGWDGYKSLVSYLLTTPDPEVIVWCNPSSRVEFSIGFGLTRSLDHQLTQSGFAMRQMNGDYDTFYAALAETPLHQRITTALTYTIADLLRPVYIRDVAINILGRADSSKWAKYPEADRYKHVGYGVGLDFDPSKRYGAD